MGDHRESSSGSSFHPGFQLRSTLLRQYQAQYLDILPLYVVLLGIFPLVLPLPFLLMGVLVCVVQALVFTLLTTVYIGQAVAHEEH